ncbi:MAG: tail fiber domain-containing protein, partial [Candidatus Acetothermia bacterium]|nr:tail fiber domain-containing protein [Candidatus Acetothermia bacterium]
WSLTGNAGTDPTTNFLGTTDNVALEIRVNNQRAFRLEPGSSPNVIGGLRSNKVGAGVVGATIAGGGATTCISPPCYNEVTADLGTVSGGMGNLASGIGATICGGQDNTASGVDSTACGGASNTAGGWYSFAAGFHANANHNGTFVWADSNALSFSSTAANEFSARATGGVRFVSAIDGAGNPTAGVYLAPGSNAWSAISDRELKENFSPVDGRLILERLSQIPISEWNMRSQDPSIRHIGPMAQDFYAAFGLGESERYINSGDADGIALISIQALYQLSLEKDEQLAQLSRELEELRASNATLQEQVGALLERLAKVEQEVEALTRASQE